MPMTEAAIDYGFLLHLYVALSEAVGPDAWIVRVHLKPFVGWIWYGCVLMALGGLLAATDRRYRYALREPRAAVLAAQTGTAR
jgi:cytochrome c-type biogenesis protein CcmF